MHNYLKIPQVIISHENLCDICTNHALCTLSGEAEGCFDKFVSVLSHSISKIPSYELSWSSIDGVNCYVNDNMIFHSSAMSTLPQLVISLPFNVMKSFLMTKSHVDHTLITSVSIQVVDGVVKHVVLSNLEEAIFVAQRILTKIDKLTTSKGDKPKTLFIPEEYYYKISDNIRQLSPIVSKSKNDIIVQSVIVKPSKVINRETKEFYNS